MMTQEQLLKHYLTDLLLPDTTHGYHPKTRNPQLWKFDPILKHNNTIVIDPLGNRTIWLWSDLHFNHKNIIKYSKRPYPNTDLMNKCLFGNYLNVVQDNDIVIWVGDITFGRIKEMNAMIAQLPGYKILIPGNHDMDHKSNSILNKYTGFDEIHPCYLMNIEDAELQYQILITHYPIDNLPDNCISIHGHIHNNPTISNKHINVSVEQINYTPIQLNTILHNIQNKHLFD